MFARRMVTVTCLPKVIHYECIRCYRKSIKIPLKITPRKSKPRQTSFNYMKDIVEANPGIGHTLKMRLEAFGEDLHSFSDDEDLLDGGDKDIADVESDMHDLREKLEKQNTAKSFQEVKRKHFRPEKLPGMLTYIEKQQILHLHEEDPDNWDPHKLSESFPASPEIIEKVLKAKFIAYTVKQILKHDEAVRKNWAAFEKGELKFNDELQKIYSKFTGRSRSVTSVKEIEKYIPPPPDFAAKIPIKEFSSIITSSQAYQLQEEKRKKKINVDEQGRLVYESSSIQPRIIDENQISREDRKHFTLDAFRRNIDASPRVSRLDTIIVGSEPPKKLKPPPNENEIEEPKHHLEEIENDTGVITKDFDPLSVDKAHVKILMRIDIPPKLWKKDKLYKVRDCFYDDNGYFLYRVPGLEG